LTRIILFNVKYSPNLGDGLLSECLEGALETQAPDVVVTSVDLALRTSYGQGGRHRRTMMRMLETLPRAMRRQVAGFVLRSVGRRLGTRARTALVGADAAVIGGGNLFADADLNFPIKIEAAASAAAATGTPVCVFGVGVSDNWSPQGRRLLRAAMAAPRLVHVAVRDARSRAIWAEELEAAGICGADLCRDPGLLVADRYGAAAPRQKGNSIGLCLTDPLALRYHGGRADRRLDGWLVMLVQAMVARGWRVQLFTNGSPEDRAYLDRMAPRLIGVSPAMVDTAPALDVPADLARLVAGYDLVIAHRMHACIAAYGYRVPALGLRWDPKLDSFFASVGQERFMIDPAAVSAQAAVELAAQALADGVEPVRHAQVIDDARADVARLFASITAARR
jgi:polysaccharide pyruvyl transferase WcaK-like protein